VSVRLGLHKMFNTTREASWVNFHILMTEIDGEVIVWLWHYICMTRSSILSCNLTWIHMTLLFTFQIKKTKHYWSLHILIWPTGRQSDQLQQISNTAILNITETGQPRSKYML